MHEERQEYSDPLIDEVRQRRRELFARYDNDLRKLGEVIRQRQAERPERVVDRRGRSRSGT